MSLTASEAAKLAGISRSRVHQLRKTGRWPQPICARRQVYSRADVEAAIRVRRAGTRWPQVVIDDRELLRLLAATVERAGARPVADVLRQMLPGAELPASLRTDLATRLRAL